MTDSPWKLKFYFSHITKLPLRRPITQKQDEIGLFWWQILKAWVLITYYTNFQAHKSFHSQDIGIQTWLFINMHDSQGSKMGIPLCLEEPQHENDLEFWQNILHMFIIYVKVPLQIFLAKSESVRWGFFQILVDFIWNDPHLFHEKFWFLTKLWIFEVTEVKSDWKTENLAYFYF